MNLPLFNVGTPDRDRRLVAVPPFQTVVADPAWQPRDALPGPKRGASKHYATMSTPDIRALSFRFPPIAPDALLFLWRLSSMPFDGLDVCRAWGFEPVSEIVWVKTPKALPSELVEAFAKTWQKKFPPAYAEPPKNFAEAEERVIARLSQMLRWVGREMFEAARAVRFMLGHYVRLSHETCIIAARPGAASRILSHSIPSVFFAPVGRHSEKPEAFFKIVEALAPGPYLELFARRARGEGWTAIGDQLGLTLDLPLAPSTTEEDDDDALS